MSATAITIIIILIIVGSIAVLFISQAREKARIEKVRKTNALQDRYRRVQRLINEIPPQYLNNELRVMILERSIETLHELATLKSDTSIQTNIQNDKQALNAIKESKEAPKPVAIKDEAASKEISKLLELLYRFIERQKAMKKLDKETSKKYLIYINYLISKVKADLAVSKAKDAQKNGKLRVAIHNYHNAVSEMMRIKENPLAVKAINSYKTKIKQLEELADKEGKNDTSNPEAENEARSKEWDNYLDKDDDWQKKNAYDD
ncbi:hypothetical protein [Alkalimarinus sediminis]|uniref:Uncharacterized protein n=1 Tax=Alkalimarinus sediminis TaxID=1632866 RepID=A0A9E8HNC6_9ALTE|nr:hypothetical protein [Alkalimarinus sediminis]UZW76111.1 hypothetical protein NNL22_05900 [Alkalimarinus sediminis]